MNLLVNEILHLSASLLIGIIIFMISGNEFLSFTGALLGGFFIDIDHLIDYLIAFGFKFNLIKFFKGDSFAVSDKFYALFHAWEYLLILLLMFFLFKNNEEARIFTLSLTLSMFVHLIIDSKTNSMFYKSYSIMYRYKNNFNLEKMVFPEHWKKHLEMKKEL